MDQDKHYIEGLKLWVAAQKNLVAQLDASTEYNKREIVLHHQAIDSAMHLINHYQNGISDAERKIGEYLKDDLNP